MTGRRNMGANLGQHAIRIAVKDRQTLGRMSGILLNVCSSVSPDAYALLPR
jgi:hypothetical protein